MSDRSVIIGQTAFQMAIPQSLDADFLWTFDHYQTVNRVRTATDLTGYEFDFYVYDLNGDELLHKTVGDSITIINNGVETVDNRTVIQFDKAEWAGMIKGCQYPYKLGQIDLDSFDKPLVAGKIYTT